MQSFKNISDMKIETRDSSHGFSGQTIWQVLE